MQARDRLFRKEAQVSLVLRVFLGTISGLAIGWFWTQDTTSTATTGGAMSLSTLSPFALAFVAGYGVELFFALLDKIIATFTNKSA
jgi:Na+/serine symporter